MTLKRNALNRGTAVHQGGSKVLLVWPCGCTRVETMRYPNGSGMTHAGVARLVRNWRANGVVLGQCPQHPNWFHRDNQVPRLNAEHPER